MDFYIWRYGFISEHLVVAVCPAALGWTLAWLRGRDVHACGVNVLQPDPVSLTQAELSSKCYLSKELVRRLELGSACSLITPQAPG